MDKINYYLYHIPGKKIGVTRDLISRVVDQQGYSLDEVEVLEQSTDIDYISDRELELQQSYGYRVDRQKYKDLYINKPKNQNKMYINATEQTSTFPFPMEELKERLNANKRELITTALEVSKTSGLIKYTLKQIDELLEKNSDSKISKDLKNIKNNLKYRSIEQDNWEVFKLRFREIHKDFFSALKTKHPELTKSELKFCAYLRIHLSSSQIAAVLNVSKEGIKKTRYRIRKKINLSTKDLLEDYISTF